MIGQGLLRKEDDRLLRGRACFVDDVPEPPGTLHLVFVLSPYAHARIVSVDAAAARAAEGVVAVLTGADFAGRIKPLVPDIVQPGFQPVGREAVPVERVRFVGEAVAVIVATSRYLAEDALDLVHVEYEELPILADADAALAEGAPLLHEGTVDNVLFRAVFKTAGFDAVFAGAAFVERDVFHSPRLSAMSIETRGCLAVYDRGHDGLTLHSSTQIPHVLRTAIADALDWDETRLRVVAPDVGGGFGMKAYLYPEELVASFLARELDAPVKWVGDRREDLLSSMQGRGYRFDVALAFGETGELLATDARIVCDVGAYPGFPFGSATSAGGAAIYLPGPYRMAHYAYDTRAVTTNTCPSGVYRGVAAPSAFFATEALMDRAARRLGIDPAELRRRNVLSDADLPYVNAAGIPYTSGSFARCLERALAISGYSGFREVPSADGMLRGIGIGCVVEHTGQGASRYRQRGVHRIPGFESALVKVEPNGRAVAWVSQTTQGQGHHTSFAQIVAEQLGLAMQDVTIVEGDTAQGPYGSGTFASRGAVVAGGAVLRAAGEVGDKLRRLASEMLEVGVGDLEMADGFVRVAGVPGMQVSVREIAGVAYSLGARALPAGESFGLEATNYYDPPMASITNATHVAQVAIDPVTGQVAVERYVVVHDCGRIINPAIVDGQIQGAIVQGISSVLSETLRFDAHGQQMAGSLLDYLVSTSMDVPDIEVFHEENWSPDTAGGFKGVGEGGVIGAVPAVVNAVIDALRGFEPRITRLPVLAEHVVAIMRPADLPTAS